MNNRDKYEKLDRFDRKAKKQSKNRSFRHNDNVEDSSDFRLRGPVAADEVVREYEEYEDTK